MEDARERAKKILNDAEVIVAMKVLASRGLGVYLIHSHDADGNFTDLKKGIVAYEEDLKISFRKPAPGEEEQFAPVAWSWDAESSEIRELMKCRVAQWCEQSVSKS